MLVQISVARAASCLLRGRAGTGVDVLRCCSSVVHRLTCFVSDRASRAHLRRRVFFQGGHQVVTALFQVVGVGRGGVDWVAG